FLVSSDFLASEYAYTVELRRALERRQAGEAEVVPVIIRPCPWGLTFAQHLQALPTGPTGLLPVKKWDDPDEAWTDVVQGLWRVVDELRSKAGMDRVTATEAEAPLAAAEEMPAQAKLKPKAKAAPAGPPALVVDAHGGGDYKTINEALTAAKTGATIMVRPGEYREGLLLDKEVAIIGDGPRDEIVVVSRDSACVKMATEQASLVNLTLRCRAGELGNKGYAVDLPMGRLRLANCDISSDSLSCLAVHGAQANPLVSNCRIHDGKQAGVYVYDKGQGMFEECDIFGNAFSDVAVREEGHPSFKRCRIHDGKQYGVSVYERARGLFEDCDIFGNARA
ncbi:MAG: right-handed parallel beta-helix repeat-containing protein, partial [Desulfobaccales bacterium]